MFAVWINTNGQVLHQDDIFFLEFLFAACDPYLKSTQDLSHARRILLCERSAHVLEIGLSDITKHFHLFFVNDFHNIFIVQRFEER